MKKLYLKYPCFFNLLLVLLQLTITRTLDSLALFFDHRFTLSLNEQNRWETAAIAIPIERIHS